MSSTLTCQSCRSRLKIPAGYTKNKARCPKCETWLDVTAALDANAYRPAPVPANVDREEDPLPYVNLKPVARATASEPPLSLDDDEPPATGEATPAPVSVPPFRTPVRVTADSANLFTGACEAVLVPHGLFLESVPYQPFLFVAIHSKIANAGRRGLAVTVPDNRTVTLEFLGPDARRLADDVAGFLEGERAVPDRKEYGRNPAWLLGIALIFALGLAVGPVALAVIAELGLRNGLLVGAGLAAIGLMINAAVVLFTRMAVPGKVAVMATVSGLVTGVFLLTATAYLAGRKHEAELAKPEQVPPAPVPETPAPPQPTPDPERERRRGLPTAWDMAYEHGLYRFADGPDDATAIATTGDAAVLLAAYRNGTTRVWRFDQLAIDPFAPGPRADGPVTRMRFDETNAIAYLTCTGGTVAAFWNNPPESPLKITGDPFAPFTTATGERFAAYRLGGNAAQRLVLRHMPSELLKNPPAKGKEFAVLSPRDEVQPADVKAPLDAPPPTRSPTFLAWHPSGILLGGQPDGSILSWGATGPSSTVISRDHKAAVRAWAASPSNWDFATGDDKGMVGLWENKATTPRIFTAAKGADGTAVGITQLVFSPLATHLAILDSAGVVWVWNLGEMRAIVRTKRPDPIKMIAFGPNDDLLILAASKSIEMWHVPELAKQP